MDLGSVGSFAQQSYPVVVAVGLALGIALLVVSLFRKAGSPADVERENLYPRRLDRSRQGMVGGVCAGIARHFGWDTGTMRAAFVVLALLTSGFGVLFVYLVLWRVMPLEPEPQAEAFSLADHGVD